MMFSRLILTTALAASVSTAWVVDATTSPSKSTDLRQLSTLLHDTNSKSHSPSSRRLQNCVFAEHGNAILCVEQTTTGDEVRYTIPCPAGAASSEECLTDSSQICYQYNSVPCVGSYYCAAENTFALDCSNVFSAADGSPCSATDCSGGCVSTAETAVDYNNVTKNNACAMLGVARTIECPGDGADCFGKVEYTSVLADTTVIEVTANLDIAEEGTDSEYDGCEVNVGGEACPCSVDCPNVNFGISYDCSAFTTDACAASTCDGDCGLADPIVASTGAPVVAPVMAVTEAPVVAPVVTPTSMTPVMTPTSMAPVDAPTSMAPVVAPVAVPITVPVAVPVATSVDDMEGPVLPPFTNAPTTTNDDSTGAPSLLGVEQLTAVEFESKLNDPTRDWFDVVVDVRSQAEWDAGHIPGATLVESLASYGTTSQISTPADLLGCQYCNVVVYCNSGARATTAIGHLIAAGFAGSISNGLGVSQWTAAGFDLVTDEPSVVPPCTVDTSVSDECYVNYLAATSSGIMPPPTTEDMTTTDAPVVVPVAATMAPAATPGSTTMAPVVIPVATTMAPVVAPVVTSVPTTMAPAVVPVVTPVATTAGPVAAMTTTTGTPVMTPALTTDTTGAPVAAPTDGLIWTPVTPSDDNGGVEVPTGDMPKFVWTFPPNLRSPTTTETPSGEGTGDAEPTSDESTETPGGENIFAPDPSVDDETTTTTDVPRDTVGTEEPVNTGTADAVPTTTTTTTTPAPTPLNSLDTMGSFLPSDVPSDMPSDMPSSVEDMLGLCEMHEGCAALNLTESCCPTVEGLTLECCDSAVPVESACNLNPNCNALDLMEDCCPTADGMYLDCCSTFPNACQEGDTECEFYSAVQYKQELEDGGGGVSASNKGISSAMGPCLSSLAVTVSLLALLVTSYLS